MLSLVLLRCADADKPRIGKTIFSSNKEGFVKIRVLFNSFHARKEKRDGRGKRCVALATLV